MGEFYGLNEYVLLKAADLAQIYGHTSRPEWQTPEMLRKYYGDDPIDQGWIRNGFKYFNLKH